MQGITLTYQAPVVRNPEPDWLADCPGEHFEALRLFHEACWAWAGYQSQRARPLASVRWGTSIANRGDLFDYAIDCRRQALLKGFFLLTTEQLDELTNLRDLDVNQRQIATCFVALCDRHDVMHDLYDQPLPAPLYEILAAIEKAPPYRNQGECALTKRIRIGKQAYYAKLTDETLSGQPPLGQDELHEVSCTHALRALQAGIGPAAAYHLLAADGQQCALIAEVPGRVYRESQVTKIAPLLDAACLQWIVLAEWLLGIEDRHFKNLLIDKEQRHAGIIDTAVAWHFHSRFLGWNEDELGLRFCESFAHALWEQQNPDLVFDRAMLLEACAREADVLTALAPFPLPAETIAHLRDQFALIQLALMAIEGEIRLVDLEQIAQMW